MVPTFHKAIPRDVPKWPPPRGVNSHPIPYTLHPTPYTLHCTPYTLHPSLFTLHPKPWLQSVKWLQGVTLPQGRGPARRGAPLSRPPELSRRRTSSGDPLRQATRQNDQVGVVKPDLKRLKREPVRNSGSRFKCFSHPDMIIAHDQQVVVPRTTGAPLEQPPEPRRRRAGSGDPLRQVTRQNFRHTGSFQVFRATYKTSLLLLQVRAQIHKLVTFWGFLRFFENLFVSKMDSKTKLQLVARRGPSHARKPLEAPPPSHESHQIAFCNPPELYRSSPESGDQQRKPGVSKMTIFSHHQATPGNPWRHCQQPTEQHGRARSKATRLSGVLHGPIMILDMAWNGQ